MALEPFERAALALRVCAAIHADPEGCPDIDGVSTALIEAARGVLDGDAAGAALEVKSGSDIAADLRRSAVKLDALQVAGAGAGDHAVAMVKDAARRLRDIADRLAPDADGDDEGVIDPARPICRCGLLGFAADVERRVRAQMKADGVDVDRTPLVRYVTAMTNSDLGFKPFCIAGKTTIRATRRNVDLVLMTRPLFARDLWHIAYTLHHELVCHAFQAVGAGTVPPDAHASCHWSEGWMDALAFELVMEWTAVCPGWLPLHGSTASATLWDIHEARYQFGSGSISPDDTRRRRFARDAFSELRRTFTSHHIAPSDAEAADWARTFSLIANAHPAADCNRLKALGTRLRILLLNDIRPEAGVAAAHACLAFLRHRDLSRLEKAVADAL